MLKQLGGKFGINLLAKEGMIELLGKFAGGRTLNESAFRGELAQIANKQKHQWPAAERLSEWLANSRVVQPGLEIQCPVCRQHSCIRSKRRTTNFAAPSVLNHSNCRDTTSRK